MAAVMVCRLAERWAETKVLTSAAKMGDLRAGARVLLKAASSDAL